MTSTEVVRMLSLQALSPDRYEAENVGGTNGVIFGGQLLAQAIAAAAMSIPGMQVKSMHSVFVRGASPEKSPIIEVERLQEGRTFGSLQVSVRQGERLCTRSLVLLHRPDADLITHQGRFPGVAPPDACPAPISVTRGWEVRVVDGVDVNDPDAVGPPELFVWSQFADVPAGEWVSQALLAYASDGFLIGTAMRPHNGVGQSLAHVSISTSVITHTLTFHDTFDAGEWLLLAHRSPHAGHGRSFGRADVFTADGRLVASYAQENMIRAFDAGHRPPPGERSKY